MHQTGLGKPILQAPIDICSPTQNQGIHHRRAGTVEGAAGPGEGTPETIR
jgi:hypothetical protein